MKFSPTYLVLTLLLFAVEVYIGLYVRDNFIRPFVGDMLVVVLLYCFLRVFWSDSSIRPIVLVCAWAFLVEFSQYFDPVGVLGLEGNRIISTLWGRTFSWLDLLAYLVGSLVNYKLRDLLLPTRLS